MSFSSGNSSLPLLTWQAFWALPSGSYRYPLYPCTCQQTMLGHRVCTPSEARLCHEQEACSPSVNANTAAAAAAAAPTQASAKTACKVCSETQASAAAQVAEACLFLSSVGKLLH